MSLPGSISNQTTFQQIFKQRAAKTAIVALVVLLLCLPVTTYGSRESHARKGATSSGDGVLTSRKVMMFLFDAFRWDYADMPGLTGFPRLFKNGVRAKYMRSEYPTNSWPNHYSLTTGLHVESHGMIDNSMYDPDLKEYFKPGNENYWKPHWWNGGDPVWITATRQGLRTRMYYWLGADVEIRGLRPKWWCPFPDRTISGPGPTYSSFTRDIDKVIRLFKSDSVDLAGLYLDRPDFFGHHNGTMSIALNKTIHDADQVVNHLLDQLEANKLDDVVDVIIFSDHGMENRSADKIIFLKDYISEEKYTDSVIVHVGGGAEIGLWPKPGKKQMLHDIFKNVHPNLTVYTKEEIPEDEFWHFKNNRLTPPIWMKADIGWFIVRPDDHEFKFKVGGSHGYDNHERDMRASFFAIGPHFKKGYLADPFPNVDVYQILCKILDIDASPHNGTWSHVADMLIPGNWDNMTRVDQKPTRKHLLGILSIVLLFLLL